MTNMIAKTRLFLTADSKALVAEGDPKGATLYCAAGDEIPESAAKMFGLVDGDLPAKGGKGAKEAGAGSNKEKQPGQNKGAGAVDDLTQVKFVGSTSAKSLNDAGITTIAQLAAIDPASPPTIEGMGARVNWAGIVESAAELVKAANGGGGAEATGQGEN